MTVDPLPLMVRISLVLLLPFALLLMNGIKPIPIGFMVFQLWVVLGQFNSNKPANNCDGGPGVWDWFTSVSTPMGNVDGFFFDGNPGPDGNPINNFGDNCEGSNLNWEFCWQQLLKIVLLVRQVMI